MSESDDREEIKELMARYCLSGDAGDSKGFAGCFTEQGVVEANSVRMVGRDAIGDSCDAYRPIYAATPMRHVTVNVVIDLHGDEAEANSYFILLAAGAEPGILRTGTYRDRLQRVDGRWYLSERIATSDGGALTTPPQAVQEGA